VENNVVQKILDLNRQFYQTFAVQFSATRQRLQPGVKHWLPRLLQAEAILDLGCGNGELARQLGKNLFTRKYVGLDFSAGLLAECRQGMPSGFNGHFRQADLSQEGWEKGLDDGSFDTVLALAVLHHLPGKTLRSAVLRHVRRLLTPQGVLLISNWQFLDSERLRKRIQPWEMAGLKDADVDPGDYLLNWRSGGMGLRYAHHFNEAELSELADTTAFSIRESFYSDGENGRLSLYQVWEPAVKATTG
jgi:SAM-dependent methyltransferase